MVTRLNTILCQVADMNRSVSFYRDVLGLSPGTQSPYWSDFDVDGVKIGLHPPFAGGMPTPSGGWILGVTVEDLRSLAGELNKAGTGIGSFSDIPGGAILEFWDPDGNPLQAFQANVKAADLTAH